MGFPSSQELKDLAQIDPEINAMVNSGNSMASFLPKEGDPEEVLRTLIPMMKANKPVIPSVPGIEESEAVYETRDGASLKLCIYKPEDLSEDAPLLVWYHGGGGCIGFPEMNKPLLQQLVLQHGLVAIAPEYRLGPEFKFPVGIKDSWDALKHIASHASEFGADLHKGFLLGGESNGGVTAAALALLARDEGLASPLTGVFLSAASFVPPHDVPEKYKDHYVSRFDPTCLNAPPLNEFSKKVMDIGYAGDYTSPLFRAILWPTGHKDLPRTYFQSCGLDINRDDSFIYQDILNENAVETKLDVYPGGVHCFWLMFPQIGLSKKWRQDTNDAISCLLQRSV
ncbi:hypothetical protein N7456_002361 [Penicillium angulare]|uniref:Alpha/beta hydrolase fold-3 domain-containing protein n=1 Tax=Penicillium angulare TaxID=116970 RepID=A0A9W9G9B0_9EURO|nr:hypothetical protein N7456_002361 [Penicillium angulare]